MKQGYFKTGKRLQIAIDNADRIDGMNEYLNFILLYPLLEVDYGSTPTFQQVLNGSLSFVPYWMLEGSIDYSMTSDNTSYEQWQYLEDTGDLRVEYVPGYHDHIEYGYVRVFIDPIDNVSRQYKYLCSVGNISEELELQAENGDCVYYNNGPSFIRVWIPVA